MDAEAASASLLAAVSALYGADASQREAANQFLLAFAEDTAAWGACIHLLTNGVWNNHHSHASANAIANANETLLPEATRYFAANMLYSKAKRHWNQLSQTEREELPGILLGIIASSNPPSSNSSRRLCLALAAVAIRSSAPENSVKAYIHQALSFGQQQQPLIMVAMLTSLPEEVDSADCSRGRQMELEQVFQNHNTLIIKTLEQQVRRDDNAEELKLCMDCCTAWIGNFGLTQLCQQSPHLFDKLLECLWLLISATENLDCFQTEKNRNVVVAACNCLDRALSVLEYPRPSGRDAACKLLLRRLLAVLAGLAENDDMDDAWFEIAKLAVSFAEKETDMVVSGSDPEGLALVDFILAMTANRSRRLARIALDFWLDLQDIPVAQRHASLASPIYDRLLRVLLVQCSINNDEDEEEEDDNEEELQEFRRDAVDVLKVAYYLLRSQYLEIVVNYYYSYSSRSQQQQQRQDSALFALSAVAKEVLSSGPSSSLDPLKRVMREIFLQRHSHFNPSSREKKLLTMECDFMGKFCALLLPDLQLVIRGIEYLGQGLLCPESQVIAASSLKTLCVLCSSCFVASEQVVGALFAVIDSVHATSLELPEWLVLTEATVRVISQLEEGGGLPLKYLERFASPFFQKLSLPPPVPPQDHYYENILKILSQVTRFLDFDNSERRRNRNEIFLKALWPLLCEISVRERDSEGTCVELFYLNQKILKNFSSEIVAVGLIESLLEMTLSCYFGKYYPCCLECLASAVEVFGDKFDEAFKNRIREVFHSSLNCLRGAEKKNQQQPLIRELFNLSFRSLLFCPDVTLRPPALLQGIVGLAVESLALPNLERDCARSVLAFITQTVKRSDGGGDFSSDVDACFAVAGAGLTHVIVGALCGDAPSLVWPNFIDCLHTILVHFPSHAAQEWLAFALAQKIPNMAATLQQKFVLTAYQLAISESGKQRFKGLMLDFAKIACEELSEEILNNYFII